LVFELIAVCELVIAEASDEVAVVTSASVASDPAVRVASVSRRVEYDHMEASVSEPPPTVETLTSRLSTRCLPTVPTPFSVDVATFHTSAAREPNELSVRVVLAHTAVGMVAKREVEAVSMVELVFRLIAV
jgi:hypothetical protein